MALVIKDRPKKMAPNARHKPENAPPPASAKPNIRPVADRVARILNPGWAVLLSGREVVAGCDVMDNP